MGEMPEEDDEAVDLDPERRHYIANAYANLASITHYDLLGVPRGADKKAIKRAYFALASSIHPDRHYGKRLGSYKPKMEVLFARVTASFEVLADPEARKRYDATLPAATAESLKLQAAVAPPKPAVDPKILARRQEAMDALKARFEQARSKVNDLTEAGARARAAGDLVAASEHYRQALVFAPDDEELSAAYAEVQKRTAEKLLESLVKKAQLEERFGQRQEAVETWRRVALADPNNTLARARLEAAATRGT